MTNKPWRPRLAWRPVTFHLSAYRKLQTSKAFSGHMHIFPVAVVIGFLLDRKRKTSRADAGKDVGQILTTDSLYQPETWPNADSFKFFKDIIFDYIATYMIKKENDREIQNGLEELADGGIEYLMEIYDKYGGKVETVDILMEIKKKWE